jgi:hypothetical protein
LTIDPSLSGFLSVIELGTALYLGLSEVNDRGGRVHAPVICGSTSGAEGGSVKSCVFRNFCGTIFAEETKCIRWQKYSEF